MWEQLTSWADGKESLLGAALVLSLATFVLSLFLVPFALTRIPPEYFATRKAPPTPWGTHHPYVRWTLLVTKNVLGAVLLAAGLMMLVLPGQGLLTILIGIALLNFPGKRRLELAIVRRPGILRAINWIRARSHHPPLVPPPPP